MNGSEHYVEAARLVAAAENQQGLSDWQRDNWVVQAQVHATLALAAATALTTTHHYVGDSQEVTDWGRIVQPDAFTGKPCDDGCVDEGRNGCPPRCVAARESAPMVDMEPPF